MTAAVAGPASRTMSGAGAWLVGGIVLATLTEAIAGTVLSLGRGDIMGDTHTTPDEFAWLDIGYVALKLIGFAFTPWLLTRVQPRSALLAATLAMGAACAVAALTAHLDLLIFLRAVQGFAGGILLVSGQALLFRAYPRSQQPTLQALFAVGSVVAPATLAPALQGWLVDNQSWTWIFFSVLPVSLTAAGLMLMERSAPLPAAERRAFDGGGLALLGVALFSTTYLLSQGSRWDWLEADRILWLSLVAGASLVLFLVQQRRAAGHALLDANVFRTEDFSFAFVVSFVAGAALFGSAFLIPAFAVSILGFTPTAAGQLLLPSAALFVGALLLAAFLMQARRVPPIATVPAGILLIMLAMWLLSRSSGESGAPEIMPAILLRGLGLGFLFLSITLIAFNALPPSRLAFGIAIFDIGRLLGGLMGVAGLQTVIDQQVTANQAVLGAALSSGSPAVTERLASLTSLLVSRGMELGAATKAAAAMLSRAVAGQGAVIAFDTAFTLVALLFVVAAPILIAVKLVLARALGDRTATKPGRKAVVAAMPLVVTLTGCAVGPDYRAPDPAVAGAWITPVSTAEVDAAWWTRFDDPLLAELVTSALAGNKDLAEASARLREARANRDAVGGRSAPQVAATAAATRNRLSENGPLPVGKVPGLGPYLSIFDAGFDASWEIDLWGGTQRAIQSAEARAQAAEEARRAVAMQVIAEVVRSYVDLRTAQSLHGTAVDDANAQGELARLVAARHRAGLASRFDVVRAEAQALATAATIPGFEGDAAAASFRLALLLGQTPEALHERLWRPGPLPRVNLPVQAGLRSDLLRRRPDVRQAERELAASSADIGVATAELFPRLSLLGSVGHQAREAGDLSTGDSLRFQIGPALRWPIFSGGRVRAQIRAADARSDAALARYERAVLNALSDSETAISRYAVAGRARAEREAARSAAAEAVKLALRRYDAGEDDLTVLLQAQAAFSAADRLDIQARAVELQQLTALYKALGGGWEASASLGRAAQDAHGSRIR